MKRYWKREEVHILKEMLKDRCTVVEIAEELGRTVGSVQKRITTSKIGLGRTGKPRNLKRLAFILDSIKIGLSVRQIAKLMKVGLTPLYRTIRSLVKQGLVTKRGSTSNSKFKVTREWEKHKND